MQKLILIALGALLASACSSPQTSTPSEPARATQLPASTEAISGSDPTDVPAEGDEINRRVSDFQAFIPPRLLPVDGVRPVYEPRFASAKDAPLLDDELIIGVAWDGEAKAYPITVLRFREMVNDELNGIPTLVTW